MEIVKNFASVELYTFFTHRIRLARFIDVMCGDNNGQFTRARRFHQKMPNPTKTKQSKENESDQKRSAQPATAESAAAESAQSSSHTSLLAGDQGQQ